MRVKLKLALAKNALIMTKRKDVVNTCTRKFIHGKSPVGIDMHGIGGSMHLQHNLTRFANISEEYGFYVVYPVDLTMNGTWLMISAVVMTMTLASLLR